MLDVARTIAPGGGAAIDWCEGDAAALPFPNGAFDVVLCQQGLQFVTDRAAALREFRRVLATRGRVALAVWGRIERNPYFLALAQAVGRHMGAEAGAQLRSSFALSDADELRSLLADAEFAGVEVRSITKSLRLPLPEDLVPTHLAGTSLAAVVAATEAASRTALVAEVAEELRTFLDADGMTPPFAILLATAHRESKRDLDGGRQNH